MFTARYEALRKIRDGYRLAGFNIYISEDFPSDWDSCFVCNGAVKKEDNDAFMMLYEHSQVHKNYGFALVHRRCKPPPEGTDVVWKHDPLQAAKGLAMICRAYASMGRLVCLQYPSRLIPIECFVCWKNNTFEDSREFAVEGLPTVALAHRECILPFTQERDRLLPPVINNFVKGAWLLPLGDCRVVIWNFLLQLRDAKAVFGAMFAG